MGVVQSFSEAGLGARISFTLLMIAGLFVWIAYTCTGWGESDDGRHYGLWRSCSDDKYNPACAQLDGWANDWWAACQAMVTFAFFGINAALFLTGLHIFVPKYTINNKIAMGAAALCISTGILYLIGVIVFGAKFKEDFIDPKDSNPAWPEHKLSYCFGLSIVAFIFEIAAGVLLILGASNSMTSPSPMP